MSVIRPVFASLVLFLILVQPNHPEAYGWGALSVFPLELPVLLLGALALGTSRLGIAFRTAVTLILVVLVSLKGADVISFNA